MDNKDYSRVRLPRWSWIVVLAGGALTYSGVGAVLVGVRFFPDFEGLVSDPVVFFDANDASVIAPYFLLLIPTVLGAVGTRDLLRIVVGGLRDGDPPGVVVKAVAWYLASALLLVVLALYSKSKSR